MALNLTFRLFQGHFLHLDLTKSYDVESVKSIPLSSTTGVDEKQI